MLQCLTEGQAARFEIQCLRSDGTAFDVEISGRIIDPDKGLMQGIVRDITERKRAEQALQDAHRKLVNAREAERRRVARELHDSVSQDLVAMQVAIQNAIAAGQGGLDNDQTRALAGAADKCTELIREVREITYGLYPPTLDALGLVASLRQLEQYCRREAEFTLTFSPGLDTQRFGEVCEISLYRIAQEAVNNAMRHAGAQRIDVDLASDGDDVTLWIADDGCGFDWSACAGRGLGLTSMNDRATAAGGELTIDSVPGRTCVRVRVPLTHTDE